MSTNLTPNELKYWLAFNQIQTLGPVRWKKLLSYFSDLETAWRAGLYELEKAGINQGTAEEIVGQRLKINPDQELEKVQKFNCGIVTIQDEAYPKLLAEIYAPPPLLYYLGKLDLNNDPTLAVVGSRKISSYGKQVTEQLVGELAKVKLTIISGLALGIDALAHKATLTSKGKTIAVLGSGIDVITPTTNFQLGQRIIESGGAIISEFPLGTQPQKFTFPIRNRVIAGLSLGTLIIEAAEKSGALITAHYALEQNREVLAVPGSIYNPNSAGTNNLIKLGAKLVTKADDVLETLNIKVVNRPAESQVQNLETETEKILFNLITTMPVHIDRLVKSSKMEVNVVNATLSLMEMKGLIKNLGNQNYVRMI